jgi:hypothetical protein
VVDVGAVEGAEAAEAAFVVVAAAEAARIAVALDLGLAGYADRWAAGGSWI